MNEVYNFLIKEVNMQSKDKIVAAISGGPDSMYLLYGLLEAQKKIEFEIIVAHVNHNIREESLQEKEELEKFCNENKLIFEYYEIEKRNNDKPLKEVESRTIRYNFFESLIEKYNATFLATAHHGDDLIETIMMRIVRGSSLRGYSGFSKITNKKNYKIIRPLITLTKEQIQNYLDNKGIKYAYDYTNSSDIYTRNRYRKNILPFLKEEDQNVHLKFLKFSETLKLYNDYINKELDIKMEKLYIDNNLDLSEFKNEDLLFKREILYRILAKYINEDEISETHVKDIISIIESDKPNLYIYLPDEFIAVKEYNKFYITKQEDNNDFEFELAKTNKIPNGKNIEIVKTIDNNSNYMTRLSSKEIKMPLIIRNRRESDKIIVKGLNKYKKVKDIFIDEKIPTIKRNSIPIVVDSENNIVWIPGVKKSKFDKSENEEYDIILRYF